MIDELVVHITQIDINKAIVADPCYCPAACALMREYGFEVETVLVYPKDFLVIIDCIRYDMPHDVAERIINYDETEVMEPHEFVLVRRKF